MRLRTLLLLPAAIIAPLTTTQTSHASVARADGAQRAPARTSQSTAPILISVRFGSTTLRARLRRNATTRSLLGRLPLTSVFRDYQGQEKLTRIRPALSTRNAPAGASARRGDIAYYAPDRVLVFYYTALGYTPGVIPLGRFTDDVEPIASRTGPFRARIKRVHNNPRS